MSASRYHRASGLLSASAGRGRTAGGGDPEAGVGTDAPGGRIEDAGTAPGEIEDAGTDAPGERDYLDHANQCGYLLKNVTLNFLKSGRMRGTSVKTRIEGLVPYQLRDFTGAEGGRPLAALSTHKDTKREKSGRETRIYSGFSGFARAIIAFLNVGVDVDSIAARHRESGGDSVYRPLSKWGVGRKAVIERLVDRRPDIDAEKIRTSFMKGFDGKLRINGRPAIKVRF